MEKKGGSVPTGGVNVEFYSCKLTSTLNSGTASKAITILLLMLHILFFPKIHLFLNVNSYYLSGT